MTNKGFIKVICLLLVAFMLIPMMPNALASTEVENVNKKSVEQDFFAISSTTSSGIKANNGDPNGILNIKFSPITDTLENVYNWSIVITYPGMEKPYIIPDSPEMMHDAPLGVKYDVKILAPGSLIEGTIDVKQSDSTQTCVISNNEFSFYVKEVQSPTVQFQDVKLKNLEPDISLVKTGKLNDTNGDKTVSFGDVIDYEFEVTNDSNIKLTNITILDPMVKNISGGSTTLESRASTTFKASYEISEDDILKGEVENTATVTGKTPEKIVTDTDTCVVDLTVQNSEDKASIELNKSGVWADGKDDLDNGYADKGEIITYTFIVKNTGDVSLTNVTLKDEKLGLEEVITTSLEPDGEETYVASYEITEDDIETGKVDNIAMITGDATNATVSNTAECTVDLPKKDIEQVPSIELNKTGVWADGEDDLDNGYADKGEIITYTFKVKNTGDVTLTKVTLKDEKLGLVEVITTSLEPDGEETYVAHYEITEDDIETGKVDNIATITGDVTNTTVSDTAECTVSLPVPSIELSKSGVWVDGEDDQDNGYADVGEIITYTFKVKNTGNVTLYNLTITEKPGVTLLGGPIEKLEPDEEDTTTFIANYILNPTDLQNKKVDNEATVKGYLTESEEDYVSAEGEFTIILNIDKDDDGSGDGGRDNDKDKDEDIVTVIENTDTPLDQLPTPEVSEPEVTPEEEIIAEQEVPLATTLPDTGSVFNTLTLMIIGLILIIAGILSIKEAY